MQNKTTVIAFVHLGINPSSTLNFYANCAQRLLPNAELVLITDQLSDNSTFPGRVIQYTGNKNFPGFEKYIKARKEYIRIAGGYWRFTIERLFALSVLINLYSQECNLLHLESDVLSFVTPEILASLQENTTKLSVPRSSDTRGIASVVYANSLNVLQDGLGKLDSILLENNSIENDMELLGIGLNLEFLDELPTYPSQSWRLETKAGESTDRILFDGWAIGQFLFGQDPLHTNNRVISGYQNPDYKLELSKLEFKFEYVSHLKSYLPTLTYNQKTYLICNLHVHSKQLIENDSNEIWDRAIAEANGNLNREWGPYVHDYIHTQKVNLIDRIRLLRRKGLARSFNNFLSRHYKK